MRLVQEKKLRSLALAAFFGVALASSPVSADYSSCAKTNLDSRDLEKIGADAFAAMKTCEATILGFAQPQLARVLGKTGIDSLTWLDQPSCDYFGGVYSQHIYFSLSSQYSQKVYATAGSSAADLAWASRFYHSISVKRTRVIKGEERDPLGNIIVPGKPYWVVERGLRTSLSFALKNPAANHLIMDDIGLYRATVEDVMSGGAQSGLITKIRDCSFEFPKQEIPIE